MRRTNLLGSKHSTLVLAGPESVQPRLRSDKLPALVSYLPGSPARSPAAAVKSGQLQAMPFCRSQRVMVAFRDSSPTARVGLEVFKGKTEKRQEGRTEWVSVKACTTTPPSSRQWESCLVHLTVTFQADLHSEKLVQRASTVPRRGKEGMLARLEGPWK